METLQFEFRPNQEFIELCKLLKFMGVADTGGRAKALVADGTVRVDGAVELRKACKIRPGQIVETSGVRILAGRQSERQRGR